MAFALYAWDKQAARRGAPRVRERTLHVAALLGGFTGTLAGQFMLRHKSRRLAFALVAWGALALHAGGWIWWARAI